MVDEFEFDVFVPVPGKEKLINVGKQRYRFSQPKERALNNWVVRPKGTVKTVPMHSWYPKDKITKVLTTPDSLGFISSNSNDCRHALNATCLCSEVYWKKDGWIITPANLRQSLLVYACRRSAIVNWVTDSLEFSVPSRDPNDEEIAHCTAFALIDGQNYTSSLGNVKHDGDTYDIRNEFFWLNPEEFLQIRNMPLPIANDARNDSRKELRFVAFLNSLPQVDLLKETRNWLMDLVRVTAPKRLAAESKYQLKRWDAGLYQLRFGALKKLVEHGDLDAIELDRRHKELKQKLTNACREICYSLEVLPKITIKHKI